MKGNLPVPALWTFQEFDLDERDRAAQLRTSPTWPELLQEVCLALRKALATGNARFGFDESSRDSRDLRANIQFPLGKVLFDRLFNGLEGYRAQFRIGRDNGLVQNARIVSELCGELRRLPPGQITARRLTWDFNDKGPMQCTIEDVLASMEPQSSKIWVCDRLIGKTGGIEDLRVSRTGPGLIFMESRPWSSFYAEDADGWLDVKGAFVSSTGEMYQLKSPQVRAANLEEHGSA